MPAVWASTSVGRTASPNTTANPRKGNMLRRETIFHSIFSIMSNFWILVWRLDGGATTIIARTVLGLVRLNRLVLRRLCRNWESSQRYGPRGLNALARFAWLRFAPARSAPPSSELWSDDKGLP